jgi:hypothetical protein
MVQTQVDVNNTFAQAVADHVLDQKLEKAELILRGICPDCGADLEQTQNKHYSAVCYVDSNIGGP